VSARSAEAIRSGLDRAQWSAMDLWIASLGIGGSLSSRDVAGIADGSMDATALEHDILACALNDHFSDQGNDHPVQYWADIV
jgi:hypothetical protein